MIIFPAMDLLDGKVVKLESEHHRDPEKIYGSVDEIGEKWMSAEISARSGRSRSELVTVTVTVASAVLPRPSPIV